MFLLILISYSCVSIILGDVCSNMRDLCSSYETTCEKCIRLHACCTWCYDMNFTKIRCNIKEDLLSLNCSSNSIIEGGKSRLENSEILDEPFSDSDETQDKPAVQIKPQKLKVHLRYGEPLTFKLQYKAAINYPLDLYYLMDLSYSMRHDVQTLIQLGSKLTGFLENLTTTYKIALGYYSDKVAIPFSITTDVSLANPCSVNGDVCEKGFDFIHALNFTSRVKDFVEKLNSSKPTANLDNLEGGTDALMQIMLCKDYIKWRNHSRKVVIIATDSLLHFAGDGILAGATKRNTDLCLLDADGSYSMPLDYDYPSLAEIYRNLLKQKIKVLFAAKEIAYSYYGKIKQVIPRVSYLGKLSLDSNNVLDLVRESYIDVVKNVRFEANASDEVNIKIMSNCNNKNSDWKITESCDNIKIGDVYTFNVTLELNNPPKRQYETIIIDEMNIAENVVLEIVYIGFNCECLKETPNGVHCSNTGEFKCAKCNCDEGWTGKHCDKPCSLCRFSNDTYTSSTCFSRGECDLSTCICSCDSKYTGEFCQFDQCKRNKNTRQICSGNGECIKGKCKCWKGYTNDDCSCSTTKKNCIAPGQNIECNGIGNCTCGECICPENSVGLYCENTALCDIYLEYVQNVTSTNPTVPTITNNNVIYTIKKTNELDGAECLVRYTTNGTKCELKYSYAFKRFNEVYLTYALKCSTTVAGSVVIISIVSLILAAGILALLVWKVKEEVRYKREYQSFITKQKEVKWGLEENAIYKSPIQQYKNPIIPMEME